MTITYDVYQNNSQQTDRHPCGVTASSRTSCVSWHQKGETSLDFNETRDDGVVVASAVCTLLQTAPFQHVITQFFSKRILFLTPNQQCPSTEGKIL